MENDNCAANVVLLQMLEKRRTRGSSTDSSSDEEILVNMASRVGSQKHKKVKTYVKDVVFHYTDSQFQQHFRISRAKFEVNIYTYVNSIHYNYVLL